MTADPLPGLGADLKTLERLCADDPAALDALDRVTQGKHGGDHRSEASKVANSNLEPEDKPSGTERQYALRKLRKDRPDLHARVLAGELSAHAAMVEGGFRQRSFQAPFTVEGIA